MITRRFPQGMGTTRTDQLTKNPGRGIQKITTTSRQEATTSMSRHMTTAQSTMRNAQTFRRSLATLHQAAIGVILCRTREPFRAIETMRDFAFGESLNFKVWTIADGWQSYDRNNPSAAPTVEPNSGDPYAAFRMVSNVNGNDTFGNGIFVMMYPHKPLVGHVGMLQVVKNYCRMFPETRKRLVLLTPPGFALPAELEDDVVILDFDTPSYAELREAYDRVIQGIRNEARRPRYSDEDVDRIISSGAGMTAHEFENAVSRALIECRTKLPNVPLDDFCEVVLRLKTEVVKRSEVLEVMPTDSIENIGGLENLKLWIRKRASCFSQDARDFGVETPKGIALIGPPGTGKTAASKAIGSVLGLPLVRFDVGRIFNSLVGESEARVRAALKLVEALAPCVLMIDEADKAFAGQARGGGGGDSGVGMRVLGALLTWMQETKAPVFMVVTANRTQNLPSEFLRRGRLDEVFSVTVPHEGERMEVLRIHLRKRGHDPAEIENLTVAAERSSGYVSAEIEAAVKDALIEAFTTNVELTGDLIAAQFGNMVPLSEAFREDFEQMQQWAEQNARPASLAVGQTTEAPRTRVRSRAAPIAPTAGGGGRAMSLDG